MKIHSWSLIFLTLKYFSSDYFFQNEISFFASFCNLFLVSLLHDVDFFTRIRVSIANLGSTVNPYTGNFKLYSLYY